MADKRLHHFQKEGIATPREERVQVTRQQNVVGFLRRNLTSTTPVTCVPSLKAGVWTLFPGTSAWGEVVQRSLYSHMPWSFFNNNNNCGVIMIITKVLCSLQTRNFITKDIRDIMTNFVQHFWHHFDDVNVLLYCKTEIGVFSQCASMEPGAQEHIQFVISCIISLISLSRSWWTICKENRLRFWCECLTKLTSTLSQIISLEQVVHQIKATSNEYNLKERAGLCNLLSRFKYTLL